MDDLSTSEGIAFVGQRSVKKMLRIHLSIVSLTNIFQLISEFLFINIESELNKYTVLEQHGTCFKISWKRTMDLWNEIIEGCEFEAKFFGATCTQ